MKKLLALLLLFLFNAHICFGAQQIDFDSLYNCLDEAIANSGKYLSYKEGNIKMLKEKMKFTESDMTRYNVSLQLYDEYHALMNDSAIAWLDYGIGVAKKMKRNDLEIHNIILKANQYTVSGFYNEALCYINSVPKESVKGEIAIEYYYAYTNLYGEMGCYTKDKKMKAHYFNESNKYLDLYYNIADKNSIPYIWKRSTQLYNMHKYKEALEYNDKWLTMVKTGTHDYAIVAFFRSEIYKGLNNMDLRKYWLAQSAICDIHCAVMDQSSLWNLAEIINDEGDVDRSYKYIEYSWACISTFSTHMRGWLVSPILTMISNKYKEKLKSANTRFSYMIIIISMLSLVLLFLLISRERKEKQLRVARNKLSVINKELESLNNQLKDANNVLASVNKRLNESNIVKDEYIGKFLSICSAYIDKLDNYRIKVNRKVKANQFNDLLRITSSQQLKEDEIKELFANFDSVFLRLFPHFVNDFNSLLQPEYQIKMENKYNLTTDLRIFALIRLGIVESSRIAEFLRYSPNSIYNYRARIKKHALCKREDFEKRVKEIGMDMKTE